VVSEKSRLDHSEMILRPFENLTNLVLDPLLTGTCHCIRPHRFARPYDNIVDFASFGWLAKNQNSFWQEMFLYVFLDKHRISHHTPQLVLHFTHTGQWGITPTGTLLVTDASEMLHTSSLGDGVGVQTLTSRTGA
jgi:hypothetical protein